MTDSDSNEESAARPTSPGSRRASGSHRPSIATLLAIAAWPLSLVYGLGSLLGLLAAAMASRDLQRRPDDRRAFATIILGFGAMVFGGCILSSMLIGPGTAPGRTDLAGTIEDGTWPTLDGGSITLASDDGRITIVDVWATWCPPCIASIPTLEAIHRDMADEFRVVSFAVEPGSVVSRWLDKRRDEVESGALSELALPTYPIVARDTPMPGVVGATRAYPTLWILGPDGTVLGEIVGMHDPVTLLTLIRATAAPPADEPPDAPADEPAATVEEEA